MNTFVKCLLIIASLIYVIEIYLYATGEIKTSSFILMSGTFIMLAALPFIDKWGKKKNA